MKIWLPLIFFILTGAYHTSCFFKKRDVGQKDSISQGLASYYHNKFHGKKTASGEVYDKNKLTAAHRTLPFGTMIKVTRLDNKQSVIVRINDRGPFKKGRIVDLSRKAAKKIDLIKAGIAKVEIEIID